MSTYECEKCGMSVNATCAKCNQPLVNDNIDKDDTVFEEKGVKIIVDPKCLLYLDGTELDFTKEGLNEGFKFTNPNEKARCGCGESFSV